MRSKSRDPGTQAIVEKETGVCYCKLFYDQAGLTTITLPRLVYNSDSKPYFANQISQSH